jgi:hypothetical protein
MSESEQCPKCESKLSPRLSTGRIVCTKCGWSDRPRSVEAEPQPSPGGVSEALSNIKGVLGDALDGAIDRERERRDREEERNESARKTKKPFTNGLGYAVICLGFLTSIQFFAAGDRLSRSGLTLTDLRSQGGQTVAEAYYQEIGCWICIFS